MTKHLPIAGTHAATTAFCAERIDGLGDTSLFVDGNGKITRDEGTLDDPRPNAFSLVQIADCPGSTPTCRAGCYVHGLEKHAKATHDLYAHNSRQIREILDDDRLACDWAMRFATWIAVNRRTFRWHVSGDVISPAYAEWIADVCRESPGVEHWIYTRALECVDPLLKVASIFGGNLVVNLSADVDNYAEVLRYRERAGRNVDGEQLRVCYYTREGEVPPDLDEGSVIFPDYGLRAGAPAGPAWFANLPPHQRAFVCPVDYQGKAPNRRCGPCDRCLK